MTAIVPQGPSLLSNHRDTWQLDLIDIDAYLHRISYRGPLEPTAQVLQHIHRAHALSIPFENLNIPLGYGVSLDIEHIQDKLVRHMRGGYCYEHNLLFAAVLEHIGFAVRRLVARVDPSRNERPSHMMLNVHVDGHPWLADVGFGSALIEPIPLVRDAPSRQGGWVYDLTLAARDEWVLRDWTDGEPKSLYAFTQAPQYPADYASHNHRTATDPASPFSGQAVAIRTAPDIKHILKGRELTTVIPGEAPVQRPVPDNELDTLLRRTFGIDLQPEEVSVLVSAAS